MQRLMQQLTKDNLAGIFEIESRSFRHPWPKEAFSESVLEYGKILTVDNVLCGFILYHVVLDEAVILNFAIHPDMRRQGHGEYLLSQSLDELGHRGCTHFFLDVRYSNATAITLYERHGFIPLGIRKNYYYDPDEDAIVMGKTLVTQGYHHDS